MSKIRAFIAVELPEDVIQKLARTQQKLKSTGARVKWVERQNLHLTMKFLGDVEFEEVNEISSVMAEAVKDVSSFTVMAKGTGAFPKGERSPRVVWAGVDGDVQMLEKIFQRLNENLVRFGVPYEKRRYSPHITIGRVRSSKGTAELAQAVRDCSDKEFGQVQVTELLLMMSELTSSGPVYTVLAHIAFGGV